MTTRKKAAKKPATKAPKKHADFTTGAEWGVIYRRGRADAMFWTSLWGSPVEWFNDEAAAHRAATEHAKNLRPVVVVRVVTRIDHSVIPAPVQLSSGQWEVAQQNIPVPSPEGKVCLTVRRKS